LYKEAWRQQILESLNNLFTKTNSILYGPKHALTVESYALDLVHSQKSSSEEFLKNIPVLQAAALLHDVGFAEKTDNWTKDGFEHIEKGKAVALEILNQNTWLHDQPELIDKILFLIEHHDDTTYSYPTSSREGHPFILDLPPHFATQPDYLSSYLMILKEADAQIHAEEGCTQEAFNEWIGQGISTFCSSGPPLATWRSMDSAIGNIRLLAKRVMVDTLTEKGRKDSLEKYDRLESFIETQCIAAKISYEPEICHPSVRQVSIDRFGNRLLNLKIDNFCNWNELQDYLRAVPLTGDNSIKPFQQAEIQLKRIDLNTVFPMALYVINHRVDECIELFDALMVKYALGLWDLPGLLEFKYNSAETQRIAPPLVESYFESTGSNGHKHILGLVDGLHRCTAARNCGNDWIRAIVASNVPYPLVPMPVEWESVRQYDSPPPTALKRRYRFPTLKNFPEFNYIKTKPTTDEDARYFFYRDLSNLGSKGKRHFDEFEPK
jgi:hypothetical protein